MTSWDLQQPPTDLNCTDGWNAVVSPLLQPLSEIDISALSPVLMQSGWFLQMSWLFSPEQMLIPKPNFPVGLVEAMCRGACTGTPRMQEAARGLGINEACSGIGRVCLGYRK